MKNLAGLMKQASQMQSRMQEMQATLEALRVEGAAGAGLVRVTLNGRGEMLGIAIDPGVIDPAEAETLRDLIVAAHADAKRKVEEIAAAEMHKATGGLDLGGMGGMGGPGAPGGLGGLLGGLKLPF